MPSRTHFAHRHHDYTHPLRAWVLHTLKWGLILVALVMFFADMLAAIWPAFGSAWENRIGHYGVSVAVFAAFIVEVIHDEFEEVERLHDVAEVAKGGIEAKPARVRKPRAAKAAALKVVA